jgi:hypothetical protein
VLANPERKQAMTSNPMANEKITTIPEFNPSGNEHVAYIKARTEELIKYIEDNVPKGRRASLALTNYEQAAMWAVKANFP